MSRPHEKSGAGPFEYEGTGKPEGKPPKKNKKTSSEVRGQDWPGYGPQAADNEDKSS